MDIDEVTNHLRTQSVEQVVAWMVQNMGHEQLKYCVRQLNLEENKSKKTKKKNIKE